MRIRSRPFRGSALSLSLALPAALLGACGGSSADNGIASKSPAEILAAAKAAADGAASVHVAGSIRSARSPLSLDLEILAGKGGLGRITQNGLSFDLITFGGTVYIKGSPAFYRHIGGPAAAALFQGKWLKAPAASGNFAPIGSLTDLRKLMDTTLRSHGTLAKGPTSTVNGVKAVFVSDVSKGGGIYIAATGKPFPLELTKSAEGGGKVIFDRWNQAVTVTPPTNAINLTQLQSGR